MNTELAEKLETIQCCDNNQEMIDNVSLPFAKRWALTEELDRMNNLFGVYRHFMKAWQKMINKAQPPKKFTVLEVGSGSGGLSLEIQKWAAKNDFEIEFHFYDSQKDIIQKSLQRFSLKKPQIHIANQNHLKVFAPRSFDFVISLHVIHHIQPFTHAVSAIEEMYRIANLGLLSADLMKTTTALPIAHIFQRVFKISKDLGEDGIKSIKRSHDFEKLKGSVLNTGAAQDFLTDMRPSLLTPYWRFTAIRQK